MLFLSKLTYGIVTTIHDMSLEHFGDITNTIMPHPPADFNGAIYTHMINVLNHETTHPRQIEKSNLPYFIPFLKVWDHEYLFIMNSLLKVDIDHITP